MCAVTSCCCVFFLPSWSSLVDFWLLVIVVLAPAYWLILAMVFPCRWYVFFMLTSWLLVLCGFGPACSALPFGCLPAPLVVRPPFLAASFGNLLSGVVSWSSWSAIAFAVAMYFVCLSMLPVGCRFYCGPFPTCGSLLQPCLVCCTFDTLSFTPLLSGVQAALNLTSLSYFSGVLPHVSCFASSFLVSIAVQIQF